MKEQYYYIYFFSKSSKSLAVIAVMIGTLLAGLRLLDWKSSMNHSRYKFSEELEKELSVLMKSHSETSAFVSDLAEKVGADAKVMQQALKKPAPLKANNPAQFEELKLELEKIKENSETFKKYCLKYFDDSTDALIEKLQGHAAAQNLQDSPQPKEQGEAFSLYSKRDLGNIIARQRAIGEQVVVDQVIHRHGDSQYHNHRHAQAEGRLYLLGDRQEGTHPEEEGQRHILDEYGADE